MTTERDKRNGLAEQNPNQVVPDAPAKEPARPQPQTEGGHPGHHRVPPPVAPGDDQQRGGT